MEKEKREGKSASRSNFLIPPLPSLYHHHYYYYYHYCCYYCYYWVYYRMETPGDIPLGEDFDIVIEDLQDLLDPKNVARYNALGGTPGIALKLKTDIKKGLREDMESYSDPDTGIVTQELFGSRKQR